MVATAHVEVKSIEGFDTKALIEELDNRKDIDFKALISLLEECGEMPTKDIGDFDDEELQREIESRGFYVSEEDAPELKDASCLSKAIDNARWGNRDDALYYLTQAIPALWPIEKLVNA